MMVIPRTDIALRPNASKKPSGNKPRVINCEINNDIGEKKSEKMATGIWSALCRKKDIRVPTITLKI